MYDRLKKFCIGVTTLGLVLTPSLSFAAVTLINPIGVSDPRLIVGNIIKAILSIVGSLALLMFVYGGVIWITSFGDAKRVDKGKTIITWTVLGLAMIAAAYVLVNAVVQGLITGSATGATS
jgi:hypothetical protein